VPADKNQRSLWPNLLNHTVTPPPGLKQLGYCSATEKDERRKTKAEMMKN
jgi:hypothetical protein